jgi:4-hydroxymandelate oxidase
MSLLNLYEFEKAAREKLPTTAFDYYAGGAGDEITLNDNQRAYDRIKLKPRALVNVAQRSLRTRVLNQEIAMPVLVAPMAFQGMAHEDGELATARAAHAAGTIMIASTMSTVSVEEIVHAAAGSQVWFQLYAYKDRDLTKALVDRAAAAGCTALVLTVDAPVQGKRERDIRNRFQLPPNLEMKNLVGAGFEKFPKAEGSGLAAYINSLFDASFTWAELNWLRSITKLPIIVKGIMCAEDAMLALEHGASGIVVSNHGGRQLDTAPATIDVMPEVAFAVEGKIEVYVDGGIRRGTDILKALAYGAKAVLLGRPVLWGLAVDGENGVKHVLDILRDELDIAMGLCGCAKIRDAGNNVLYAKHE